MLPHSEIAATPVRIPYAWRIQRFHKLNGKCEFDLTEFTEPDWNKIENMRRSWRVVVTKMIEADARTLACLSACEGLPQDALDGGWTAAGISAYAKSLEDQLAGARTLLAEVQVHGLRVSDACATKCDLTERINAFVIGGAA